MAELNGMYDPDAAPSSGFELLPEADYILELIESDVAATANGKGTGLKYKASVVEGEHKGRLIFGYINLQNDNPEAQRIGQSEFSALRRATGVIAPEDTQDLHFKAFRAKIGVKAASKGKDGKEYGPQNVIKKFYFEDDADTAPPAGKAETTKPAATTPTTAAKRPWSKK